VSGGLTVGSLFSGVGGFDMGLENAGHRVLWQVEKDAQAASVLRRHWPDVQLHEDVRNVGGSNLAPVDLICGGFPCQDLSVAGRRAGLDGARSGLWHEFHRIVGELVPRWVLVENVPGLRSSAGGRDLAVILRGLAGLGYVGAWRSLDSRHFGVAQRRERVFLLACRDLGAGSPAEVLAIPEGLSGHPAPGAQAREGSAGRAQGGLGEPGGVGFQSSQSGVRQVDAHATLDSNNGSRRQNGVLASALPTKYRGDPHEGTDTIVAPLAYRKAQKAHDPDDSERWEEADAAGTLGSHSPTTGHAILAHTLRSEGADAGEDGTGRGTPLVIGVLPTVVSNGDAHSGFRDERGLALAFQPKASAHQSMNPSDVCPSIGATKEPGVFAAVPRRLTPRECERLQGWPDDWTRYGRTPEGKTVKLSDSARYRMAGNGVTGTVAEWIGRRLMLATEGGER
jgi:DNA (cytosine-5)-methyltransferase 1